MQPPLPVRSHPTPLPSPRVRLRPTTHREACVPLVQTPHARVRVRAPAGFVSTADRARLKQADKQAKKLLRQLNTAAQRGSPRAIERAVAQCLGSYSIKLVAAWSAAKTLWRRRRRNALRRGEHHPGRRYEPTIAQLFEIAATVDLNIPTDELVTQFDMMKSNGGRRRLSSFLLEHLTRQHVIMAVLEANADLHPGQMAASSAGLKGAYDRVIALLNDPEVKWVAQRDIRTFFDAIGTTELHRTLGLPEPVVRNNISFENMRVVHRDRADSWSVWIDMPNEEERNSALRGLGPLAIERHTPVYEGDGNYVEEIDPPSDQASLGSRICSSYRRSIPQGAACSTIAGEYIVAGVLKNLPNNVRTLSWIDNLFVAGRTRSDVDQATDILRSQLREAPTGPFETHCETNRRVADGFEFLGAHFQRRRGRVTFRPTNQNIAQFNGEVEAWCALIFQTGTGYREARQYVEAWCQAFDGWSATPLKKFMAMESLKRAVRLNRAHVHGRSGLERSLGLRSHTWGSAPLRTDLLWRRLSILGVSGAIATSGVESNRP